MALSLIGAAIPLLTNITQLGVTIQAKVEADHCISSLYAYFMIKCDLALKTHFLWLRIGFIVGPAQTGGKRYSREVKLAELADVQDFPQKMQDSNFTTTLNQYLLAVQNDLVGRRVMHHNKPNEDFDEVLRLLNDAVFQPMIIFLSHYQSTSQTTTSQNSPPSSTQPQQTAAVQGQSFFPYGNLSQSQNSSAVFDRSLPLPSPPQAGAINNNNASIPQSNVSQSSNTAKTREGPAVPAQKQTQSQNAVQVDPSPILQGGLPNDELLETQTQGSLASIMAVNPSSSTTSTTQGQSGSTLSSLPPQGVYLLTPLSYQGQQPQPQSQPKTSNLVDQQGNLFFKPIATPNLF